MSDTAGLTQDQALALVKAGAFSKFAEHGIPEDQWETKFAAYIEARAAFDRAAAVAPTVKQAMDQLGITKPAK